MKVLWLADESSPHIIRWVSALREKGISIECITMERRRPRIFYAGAYIRILSKVIKKKPPVIHAHYASSYGVVLSLLPGRHTRIISIWGSDVLITPNRSNLSFYLVKHALDKAHIRIANSPFLSEKASKITLKKIYTIQFGIKLSEFVYCPRKIEQTFVLCVAKRLHSVSGIDTLLRALNILISEKKTHRKIALRVAGSGPERDNLMALQEVLGLTTHIEWLGWIDEAEVSGLYRSAHLAVFPSRSEGLSVSTLQAMASGTSVLASRTGGLIDLVGEEESRGVFFENTASDLAKKIAFCMDNFEGLSSKRKIARRYIQDSFDIDKNVDQLVELYRIGSREK